MYKDFFDFKENPFNVTADSSLFYASKSHSAAFSHINFGVNQRKGIMAITGEVGSGKTTLCRKLIKQLDNNVKSALILNPKFSDTQLIQLILHDFGVETKSKNKFVLINALNDFLLSQSSMGCNVVVIIDEAQNLTPKQLESIRLLSNIETEKEKLLQIILAGQPELNAKLKLPSLRQLNQRISVRYFLDPLKQDEITDYIHHRLTLASNNSHRTNRIKFHDPAIDKIFNYSKGIPRLINLICDRALLASFVNERYDINEEIIDVCAKELVLT